MKRFTAESDDRDDLCSGFTNFYTLQKNPLMWNPERTKDIYFRQSVLVSSPAVVIVLLSLGPGNFELKAKFRYTQDMFSQLLLYIIQNAKFKFLMLNFVDYLSKIIQVSLKAQQLFWSINAKIINNLLIIWYKSNCIFKKKALKIFLNYLDLCSLTFLLLEWFQNILHSWSLQYQVEAIIIGTGTIKTPTLYQCS